MTRRLTLTEQTFDEEVKGSTEPILVDFWAEWCGPCKMIAPVLDEIATENPGKLKIGKINIDENLELARRFEVMSIPPSSCSRTASRPSGSWAPRARDSCCRSCIHFCRPS